MAYLPCWIDTYRNARCDLHRHKRWHYHKAEVGDSISCPPNVAHWHGAGLESSGTHIALTQYDKDSNVIWGDKLSDTEYLQAIKQAEKRK